MDNEDEELDINSLRILSFMMKHSPILFSVLVSEMGKRLVNVNSRSLILALISQNYLKYGGNEVNKTILLGETPPPSKLTKDGNYEFTSQCWSCDRTMEPQSIDVTVRRIHWSCSTCQVKWALDIP